jgi:hypothetical protein
MGAALTYARRYALFALVGIAGEDDLDAPDLQSPMSKIGTEGTKVNGGQLNGGGQRSAKPEVTVRAEAPKTPTANPVLGLHASAKLRERLIVEIGELASPDDAAKWVQQSLAEKNRLRASDAAHVEANFATKLAELATTGTDVAQAPQRSLTETRDCAAMDPNTNANHSNERAPSHAIDKSALALPEPRRVRDRDHIRSIIQKPCLVCGRQPSDPHHLRFAQSRALSSKVSDQFTVPLCRGHHRELHRSGDEVAWWERQGIDALGMARVYWHESHPLTVAHEEASHA